MTTEFASVVPLPGAGLLARAGDLLLAVADAPEATELLRIFAAAAAEGVDGNTLVRRAVALLAADEDGRFPACALGGESQGRFAVLVYGTAKAEVTGADGTVRLSGADAITAVSRFVPGPVTSVRLLLPGVDPATADGRLHLAGGVVTGAGLVAVPGTGGYATLAGVPAAQAVPARMSDEPATPPSMAPVPMAAEPAMAGHDHAGHDHAMHDHAMHDHGAAMAAAPVAAPPVAAPPVAPPPPPMAPPPMAPPPPPVAPPMAPQPMAPQPVPAQPVAPQPGPVPAPVSAPPAPQAPPAAQPGPPAAPQIPSLPRVPDPAKPFESVLLIPGMAPEAEPAPAPAPVDNRPLVDGVLCKNDHFNDPDLRYCQVCGIAMVQQTLIKHKGPRPPLGVLLFDDGMTFRLDTDYLVGRDPAVDQAVATGTARPLRVVDPQNQVSRVHLRIALVGWQVQLIDQSANGTYLQMPKEDAPVRVGRGQAVPLKPGAQVYLGQRWFRYESHRNP